MATEKKFPLTKDNVRSQLPAVVHRFLWCTVSDLAEFRQIVTELYAPDAGECTGTEFVMAASHSGQCSAAVHLSGAAACQHGKREFICLKLAKHSMHGGIGACVTLRPGTQPCKTICARAATAT